MCFLFRILFRYSGSSFDHDLPVMKSFTVLYTAFTTSLSAVEGIQFALSHGNLPESSLHRIQLVVYISTFACAAVSLGLSCSNSHRPVEEILRGLIALLITLPGVMWHLVLLLQKLIASQCLGFQAHLVNLGERADYILSHYMRDQPGFQRLTTYSIINTSAHT